MGIDIIDKAWDREVDVIVLGAGPAGMAAAIVSKNEGQEPLILEKTEAIPAFLIADAAAIKKYGVGLVLPGSGSRSLQRFEKSGYLHSGQTLLELARKIGVDPQGLERTVKRANRYASTGLDEEFGKGSTAYNTYKGDPTHAPNPCLGPIERAPFYAVKLEPGDFGTSRGLVTGPSGEVLDQDNRPIQGLYACGNDMNSPLAGHYIGAGITLGPALTFGYLAAQALAAKG